MLLSTVAVVVAMIVIPSWWAFEDRGSQVLAFPAALYTFLLRQTPLVLVFPLVMAFPYTVQAGGEVTHRFLPYSRTRMGIRRVLLVRFAANAVAVAPVAFLAGFVPYLLVAFGGPTRFRPDAYSLDSPERVAQAEQAWATLSQLVVWHPWAFPLAFSAWLAVNGALYATLGYAVTVLTGNRVMGLTLPWVTSLLASFAMAAVGLEAYSPGLLFPFNLQQLPIENLVPPFAALAAVTAAIVGFVLIRAPELSAFQ